MKIDRLLSIVILLLNREKMTAKELSDYFEVSERTIYRDIDSINLAGIPIIAYQGSGGGFAIMENFAIDRQVLTFNDVHSIVSSLKGIYTAFGDRKYADAKEKIENIVSSPQKEELKRLDDQLVIDILPWGFGEDKKDLLQKLHRCINNKSLVSFKYCNAKGEETERTIEPMTLIFKGYSWYLFAFCLLKEDFRYFRVSRIREFKVLCKQFKDRGVRYSDYSEPRYIQDDRKPIEMKLLIDKTLRYRVEEAYSPSQIEYKANGSVIVTVVFPEDDWVYGLILSYGEKVEVLSPDYLKVIIKEKAEKIYKKYN